VVDLAWGSSLRNDCARISRVVASGSKLLVTCSEPITPAGGEAWEVWRVTAAGELDPTFGELGDGIAFVPTVNEVDVAPLPGGGFLALGYAAAPPSRTSVTPLVAFVFSAAGRLTKTTEITIPVEPLSDAFDGWRVTARLLPTATGAVAVEELESSRDGFEVGTTRLQHFDAAGAVVDDLPFTGPSSGDVVGSEFVWSFAPLPGGRTALAGQSRTVDLSVPLETRGTFLRVLRPDGSPDPGFGTGGSVPLALSAVGARQPLTVVATNGSRFLVVAGQRGGAAVLERYDAGTGVLDPTFGDGGHAGVTLKTVDALATRAGIDQLYLRGTNAADRPAVARVWDQTVP
jgi:hypothetical protein